MGTIDAPAEIDLAYGEKTTVTVTLDVKPAKPGDTHVGGAVFSVSLRNSPTYKFVSIDTPAECTTRGPNSGFDCWFSDLPVGTKQFKIAVTAAPQGDMSGDEHITYSLGQSGRPAADAETNVKLRRPVDLASTRATSDVVKAAPGTTFDVRMGAENVISAPVAKPELLVVLGYGLQSAQRYSNCAYGTSGVGHLNTYALCKFDNVTIKPGESYALDGAYRVAVAGDIPALGAQFTRSFLSERERVGVFAANKSFSTPEQGAGPELRLVKASDKAPDKWVNFSSGSVEPVNQTSHVTAQQVVVNAAVGQEIDVRTAVRNDGAATLNTWEGSEGGHASVVFFPKGVTVVKAPEKCLADDGLSQPYEIPVTKPEGGSNYACFLPAYEAWKAGTDREFVFRVKLTEPLVGVKGHNVGLNWRAGDYSVADILFDTSKPAPTPGVAGGTSGGQQPPGDNGPELAETGGSSSTPVIAGVAGGLLVIAAAAFVVVRRRKASAGGVAV